MRAKFLTLLLGFALIGIAAYFHRPAAVEETVSTEEESAPVNSGRPANPSARPPLFQTVSYHPTEISAGQLTDRAAMPVLSTAAAEFHWNSIAGLVACATTSSECAQDLPNTDPSSKFFALRDRMLDELDWFISHRAAGRAQSAQLVAAAKATLTVPDDQIQCRSLDILLREPPDSATAELVAKHMDNLVDADCVPNVLKVMRQSLDAGASPQVVTDFVCKTILNGAMLSSKEMARLLTEVITDDTRSSLESCMAKLGKSERLDSMRRALYPSTAI